MDRIAAIGYHKKVGYLVGHTLTAGHAAIRRERTLNPLWVPHRPPLSSEPRFAPEPASDASHPWAR